LTTIYRNANLFHKNTNNLIVILIITTIRFYC